jgi:hypothetical protein
MSISLDLIVAIYSTRDTTEAAYFHLLQTEQSGIVEIIDDACIRCLSRYHIEFWTPPHLETRPHHCAVIQGLNSTLLAISEPSPMDELMNQMNLDWGSIEEPGDVPLALEIRDYLLPGMAGLVLIIESPWLAKVSQAIDGHERLLKRCLTLSVGTSLGDEFA